MKLFCASLCFLAAGAVASLASVNPQLHQVKRVYILAMGSGMDQFLANQLTQEGIFEVVTDPKMADAIVTDNVGEAFQKKLDELYPPPKPATPKKEAAKAEDAEATKPAADSDTSIDVGDSKASDSNASDTKPAKNDAFQGVDFSGGASFGHTSLGRGRGNFFVVDRSSRIVLWSVYARPKNSTPGELTKTAARVVKHLKDDLTDTKPSE